MKYFQMTKNYIFRQFDCGLTVEETANLCFKSVRTVKKWDEGALIPPECKRLMRMYRRLELSPYDEWIGFSIENRKLKAPNGQAYTPQQILTGLGLIEISSELEIKTSTKLLKTARAISEIKGR
ncbi:regulator [Vibrio galatheae]|uniref:Regulator n=1 Tax=Vibrio galatheae TaxID=579748 RepID=A0A0F4NH55_9VIBR|nr:phage protein [Vibrio galatheae]KJY82427.1 regulator [Vibrio galatheae]